MIKQLVLKDMMLQRKLGFVYLICLCCDGNEANVFEFIETTVVASISFILVYLSFVLPISFWLAYKKTVFITIFIFIVPIVILETFFQINLEQIQLYNSLLFGGSICMFIASVFVSVKLYEKREF